LEEAERSMHDALCVLVSTVKNNRVIYGGGNSEMIMASAVDKLAKGVKGKKALAIEAYARALR
jgi:T-complex protein 1 subunit beta